MVNPAVPVPSGRPVGLVPQTMSTCTELLVAITTPIDSDITGAELRSSVTRARDVLHLVAGRESVMKYPARPGLTVDVTLIGGAGWSQTITWQPPRACTASAARSSFPRPFSYGDDDRRRGAPRGSGGPDGARHPPAQRRPEALKDVVTAPHRAR